MCKRGDEWQERLAGHFRTLADRRATGRTVFALEHGLTADELDDLRASAVATFASPSERSRHWLPLAVHAAEVAYDYAGDEYWPSFARKTPGWDPTLAARHEVRETFRRFAREYRGPTPHGLWAEWFTIICWPIANAILPTDLQRQLARALYLAGPGLGQRLDDMAELGRHVAASAWEGSDRFQQLREQPLLLGQIALALLRPDATTDTLLLESTLRRIVTDLESERSAAGWIRHARGALVRSTMHLSGTRIGVDHGPASDLLERVARVAQLTAPEVFLRCDASDMTWGVWLSLPNLSPLADLSPTVREALLGSKCSAPAADTPIARGRLLFDSQDVRLMRWPRAGTPLIRFQGLAAGLESALMRAWAAPETPAVYRVRTDGTGHRVASRVVRAGQDYLVAHETPPDSLRHMANLTRCSGVHVSRIAVPSAIEPRMARTLRDVGCRLSQEASIWPAGVVPVGWDGEGSVEWLASDVPMLGVEVDHELIELSFDLLGTHRETTGRLLAGSTVFITLPQLPVGTHELLVKETPLDGAPTTRQLVIRIREPRRAAGDSGPIRMWPEPYSTDLGQLWAGATTVCIAGPARETDLRFILSTRPAGTPSATVRLSGKVPLGSDEWRALFDRDVRRDDDVASAFDNARWGRVEVDAGPFGSHALEFERSLPSLRWAIARPDKAYTLALSDDSEGPVLPEVAFAAFGRPDDLKPLSGPFVGNSFNADGGGGLYVARRGADQASIVAPPKQRVFRSLDQLKYQAHLAPAPVDPARLRAQFQLLALWSRASLPGNWLASVWRAEAVSLIQGHLIGAICGPKWRDGERAVTEARTPASLRAMAAGLTSPSPATRDHIRAITSGVLEVRGIALERRINDFRQLLSSVNQFADRAWSPISRTRGPGAAAWAAEFYLRLATDADVDSWAGTSMVEGLALAVAWSLPVRVARFLALATMVGSGAAASFQPPFDGWAWR
jgi:hypothetical protein